LTQKRFKVVRVDRASDLPVEEEMAALAEIGAEVTGADCKTEDEVIRVARDADAILVVNARITRRVMEALPRCQVIVRYGIGFDTIDIPAATDNGILVVNIPDFCLEEVSNHAVALLLALARKLTFASNCLRRDSWAACKQALVPMGSIYGQTLGIIGCGNIGRLTAKKARCFDLKIVGYDPYLDKSEAEAHGIRLVSLPELLRESDFISLHTPYSEETRHLIGEAELRQMKPTAYLINTARGAIVDEAALIRALEADRLAGAGLDVFEPEPIALDNPLLKLDNVIATPHSASYCEASYARLKRSVGQEAARVLKGRWPKNLVNKGVKPKVNLSRED
jgi:D-3-phosphoglycerate dehydrogenase